MDTDSAQMVKRIKQVEDLLEQCVKIEPSETTQKIIQLFSLVNENSHKHAKEFYTKLIVNYWKTIKENILKTPFELENSVFVIEPPLKIEFGKILSVANNEQKQILALHFKAIASSIWPSEFPESDTKEADMIDSLFESLMSMEHLQDPQKTPASVIQHLGANKDLLNKAKDFMEAMTNKSLSPRKVLEYIVKKVDSLQESLGTDDNIEELKTIIADTKDKPLDYMTAFQLLVRLKQTGFFKYFLQHRDDILDNIPIEAKELPVCSDVLNLLSQECHEEN